MRLAEGKYLNDEANREAEENIGMGERRKISK
jgi:hypothetical protein